MQLVQDYQKRERRKQEFEATAAKEAERAKELNNAADHHDQQSSMTADAQQNATTSDKHEGTRQGRDGLKIAMQVIGQGILFLEDGTWWSYKQTDPARGVKGTMLSPQQRGPADVFHRHQVCLIVALDLIHVKMIHIDVIFRIMAASGSMWDRFFKVLCQGLKGK